jgi:hypothetical protein
VASSIQKRLERHFVEEAARCLGRSWSLGVDREAPDFLVEEGEERFGLEICQIFTGLLQDGGSVDKRNESRVAKIINVLRLEYEAVDSVPLIVKLSGDLCAENLAMVVPKLLALELVGEPVGREFIINMRNGSRPGLRMYVTKGLRPNWINVADRVGWLDWNPMPRIAAIVDKMSQKLWCYERRAGLGVRLLIVADKLFNSGKLALEAKSALDRKGFQEIYFFSYPETVVIFD